MIMIEEVYTMMTDRNLIFILGIAAGIGITLLIEVVILFMIFLLVRGSEGEE